MKQDKGITWLASQIREAIPRATIELHRPRANANGWILDATFDTAKGERFVVVTWSKSEGFGIATPDEDWNYGDVPGEYRNDPDDVLARALHLLKTGENAYTRREMELQELRKHRKVSQEMLAKAMKVTQASISQTEQRDDVLLSSLQNYVAGLGGELHVIAKFPGETIELELSDGKAPR
jgi:hypothetical protein